MKNERTIMVMDSIEGFTIREEWKDDHGIDMVGQIFMSQEEVDFIYAHSKLAQAMRQYKEKGWPI